MPTVKSPPRNLREVDCDGCGFVLEYRPSEVKHFTHDQDVGDTIDDEYDYIVCPRPGCKRRTKIVIKPNYGTSDFDWL